MRIITLAFLVLVNISFAQQRLSLDVSYRKMTVNSTVGYHKVFSNNWLISGAITYGGKGRYSIDYRDYPSTSATVTVPYSDVNQSLSLDGESYQMKRYDVKPIAVTAQIGLGYFYNFDVKHGVRSHINAVYGIANNQITAYYTSDQDMLINQRNQVVNFISAVSTELYHTIHLWKKSTFFYGLKVPYYFPIDKKRFNPVRIEEGTYGLEPEITLGITLLIGKC